MRSTYVASSMEEARRDAEEGIMSSFVFNDPFRGRQVFTNPGEVLDPGVNLDWDFLEPRTLLVGSPEKRGGEGSGVYRRYATLTICLSSSHTWGFR